MNTKLQKLLNIITEALGYNKPDDNNIHIYQEELIKMDFSTQDIDWGFKKLIEDKVITKKQIKFAPIETQPSNHPTFTVPASNIYTKPVYFLEIDRKKLETRVLEKKDIEKIKNDASLFNPNLKPELTAGKLSSYNDGTIRYDGEILNLRPQIKELCRYFMENPRSLKTIDDVKENVIRANKRKTTPNATIAKYMSELRNSLNPYFKKNVFPNEKEEGWYFEP